MLSTIADVMLSDERNIRRSSRAENRFPATHDIPADFVRIANRVSQGIACFRRLWALHAKGRWEIHVVGHRRDCPNLRKFQHCDHHLAEFGEKERNGIDPIRVNPVYIVKHYSPV